MQPINAVAFAFDGIFKGLGEAKTLRNTLLISTFFVFFPIAWLNYYFGFGFIGIWLSLLVWMISRGTLLAVIFKKWLKRYAIWE
jgi:Na+-driven multidrug efflux pump